MRKSKPKVGAVYRIDYSGDKYAYGRVLNDNGIQIFDPADINDDINKIHASKSKFTVTLYNEAFTDPRMQLVGFRDFEQDEDAWPPATYIYNPVTKKYSIYYKGQTRESNIKECESLEPTVIWGIALLIERLSGTKDWLDIFNRVKTD